MRPQQPPFPSCPALPLNCPLSLCRQAEEPGESIADLISTEDAADAELEAEQEDVAKEEEEEIEERDKSKYDLFYTPLCVLYYNLGIHMAIHRIQSEHYNSVHVATNEVLVFVPSLLD